MSTRSGEGVSAQVAVLGCINNLKKANFKVEGGHSFNIKNESQAPIRLSVKLSRMDEFIETTFDAGWNPEVVIEIKKDESLSNIDLKYGY